VSKVTRKSRVISNTPFIGKNLVMRKSAVLDKAKLIGNAVMGAKIWLSGKIEDHLIYSPNLVF